MEEIKSRKIYREKHINMFRNVYGPHRDDRYIEKIQLTQKVNMPSILKEIICNGSCSAAERLIKQAIEFNNYGMFDKGFTTIGKYEKDMVFVFSGEMFNGICGLRVTYSMKELENLVRFIITGSKEAKNLFLITCKSIVLLKQRMRMLDDKETAGILYSTYPEEDDFIKYGCIIYGDDPKTREMVGNPDIIKVINSVMDDGCTMKDIDPIIPDFPEARFLYGWTDEEIYQASCLKPGISSLV